MSPVTPDMREKAIEQVEVEDKGPPLTAAERKIAGIKRMRDLMKASKIKGNPKDYVLATNNSHIADYCRGLEVQASLPVKIDVGEHVWVHDRNAQLRPVAVVKDDGDNILVKNEVAEWLEPRSECYPIGLPLRPALIHKSQLRFLVGETVAGEFWNHRLRMRVNPR